MSHLEEIQDTLDDQLETWRAVVGFEGRYEVSDLGRVRSLVFCGKKGIPVVMLQQKDRGGYLRMALGGERKNVRVHCMVAEAFLGPRPEKHDVNHKNGIKSDNRLENLEWATESQNTQHSFDNGLQVAAHGENHYASVLTAFQVLQIRALALEGKIPQTKIATVYGIRQSHVSKIKRNILWKSLEGSNL